MAKARSNASSRTARRASKRRRGKAAGRSAKGSAARRPGKSARTRTKDKQRHAENREILKTGTTPTGGT